MKLPNARALSRLGPRGTFGVALLAVAEENPEVLGLTADLAITAGMERFRLALPDRFMNVGIAEQNLVGVASGLAEDGWVPFAATFANFAALRSCEFVRHHMGYMRQNVKLVGIGAGFAMGQFGTTHYSIEDIAALRGIPNLTIINPADCQEVAEAVVAAAQHTGPIYLRLSGVPGMPVVDQGDTAFRIGSARHLRHGTDVTLVACGTTVARCVSAAERLDAEGISAGVVNMHTIKPLDTVALDKAVAGRDLVVTVEEHSVIGGLGSAVAEVLAETGGPPLVRLGVPDSFPKVGSPDYVLTTVGLDPDSIADAVRVQLGSNSDREYSHVGRGELK